MITDLIVIFFCDRSQYSTASIFLPSTNEKRGIHTHICIVTTVRLVISYLYAEKGQETFYKKGKRKGHSCSRPGPVGPHVFFSDTSPAPNPR
jgi:hypothetical protein